MRNRVRLSRVRLPRALALSAAVAAFLVLPGLATAQITTLEETSTITDDVLEPYPTLVWGITFYGAFGTVSMNNLNEAIDRMNARILVQGTTVFMEHFSAFLGGGAGIRTVIKGRAVFDVVYETMSRTEAVGGASARNIIEIPVHSVQATLGWDFLKSKRDTRFGFAAGVGYYKSRAKQTLSETIDQEPVVLATIDLEGSGWGSHYKMFFENSLTEKVFIFAEATWRVAKVDDIEFTGLVDIESQNRQGFVAVQIAQAVDADGRPLDDPDSPEAVGTQFLGGGNQLDWSGFEGRVGMTYYFNVPSPW